MQLPGKKYKCKEYNGAESRVHEVYMFPEKGK